MQISGLFATAELVKLAIMSLHFGFRFLEFLHGNNINNITDTLCIFLNNSFRQTVIISNSAFDVCETIFHTIQQPVLFRAIQQPALPFFPEENS